MNPVANTVANEGRVRLTNSANANDDVLVVGQDEITVTSNSTALYIDHNDITRTNTTTGNTSPNYAGTFTAVDSITTNARGHVTAVNTKTVTMPSSNNTTYDLATAANTVANEGIINLTGSDSTTDAGKVIGLDDITISSNTTAIYVDHADVARSNNTSTAAPTSGGTFTAIDSITTSARGHVTAINTKTVTLPVDPNTTYDLAAVANTTANAGRIRLTDSGSANDDVLLVGQGDVVITSNSTAVYINSISYGLGTSANDAVNLGYIALTRAGTTTITANVVGQNEITVSSNSTAVYVDHGTVARSNTTSSASPASGGTFTAVDSVTTNARGHVTALNLKTVTLPVDPNTTYTSSSVANTAANEGRVRLTSSGNVNTDVLVVGQGDVIVTSNATALYINSTSYGLGTQANDAVNIGYIALTRAGLANISANVVGLDEITISSNSTAIYVDHNDVARSNNTSTASPASGGTFTAIDSITTNARGHVTAINTKTVTLPVDPNTTYTGANGVALNGTQFYANVGATLVANASGIHLPSVATAGSSTGGISAITIDAQGRVTSVTGSAGYVTSSGVTSVATGSGLTGGTITTTGNVSVLANTGIVANATGLYVNSSYIGTLTSNNATNLNGQAASYYTNATNIGTGTLSNSRLNGNVVTMASASYQSGKVFVAPSGSTPTATGAGDIWIVIP